MIKLATLILENDLKAEAEQLQRDLLSRYPLKDLHLYIAADRSLYISSIRVKNPGRGVGSKVMAEIKAFADKHNLTITLSPQADSRKKEKLSKFYKNMGFIPNKGRRADYRLGGTFGLTLYRRPGVNENEKENTGMIRIYRGVSVYNRDGRYFTTEPEWARNFTQSGQDHEIIQCDIPASVIYKKDPLPEAVDESQVAEAIREATQKGFAAIWVDEGINEPSSIYVMKKSKLKNVKRYDSA